MRPGRGVEFAAQMAKRFFEDFVALVGQTLDLGSHHFTSDSIIAFATEYDPQPMHVDPERARASAYAGLIASGWHTASVFMRLLVDGVLADAESLGSPGLDSLRWLKPVYPGDTLRGRVTILDARDSRSRPEWGIVRTQGEMLNQHDELVLQLVAIVLFGRRATAQG